MTKSCFLFLLLLVPVIGGGCSRKGTLTAHVNESFSLSFEGEVFDPFIVKETLREMIPAGTSRKSVFQRIKSTGFGSEDFQEVIDEQDGTITLYVFGEHKSGISEALLVVFEFDSSQSVEDISVWIESPMNRSALDG